MGNNCKRLQEAQLEQVRDILKDNRNELHEETKVKLSLINQNCQSTDLCEDRLNTITELETTGMLYYILLKLCLYNF